MRSHVSIALALASALSLAIFGGPAAAKEGRQCSSWKFDKEGGAEGEPAASLSCGKDVGFAVQCAGSFIGNLRYFADAPGEDYRLFRFKVGVQSFDLWLRLEEMDGASAGYQEFEHPLYKALAKNATMTITDVAAQKSDTLPLKGFSAALAGLRKACESAGQ
jgi:hypothetical protein